MMPALAAPLRRVLHAVKAGWAPLPAVAETPAPEIEPVHWQPDALAEAEAEGWTVFDCGTHFDGRPNIQLQRVDDPVDGQARFAADVDAWTHVVARARAGSALHLTALAAIDPAERHMIRTLCGDWPRPI